MLNLRRFTKTLLTTALALGAAACGGRSPNDVCQDWSNLMAVDMAVSPEMTNACQTRVEKMKQDKPEDFKRYADCVAAAHKAWLDKTKDSKAAKQDLRACERP